MAIRTITSLTLGEATITNQTVQLAWKRVTDPDSAYTALPEAVVAPDGHFISPENPYVFDTPGENGDIDVQVIPMCDLFPPFVGVIPGLGICCPTGWNLSPDGVTCTETLITEPTIQQSGVCVAPSNLSPNYSGNGCRFWALQNYAVDLSDTNYVTFLNSLWRGNPVGSGETVVGGGHDVPGNPPSMMNKEGVWVDVTCSGHKSGLTAGQKLQFTVILNETTAKIVFIGMGGDNSCQVSLNGTLIAGRNVLTDPNNFDLFWVFPIQLISGTNYLTFTSVGDGTTSDACAYIVLDNTAAEIAAATVDSDLNYLFKTSQMIGAAPIDIATCPAGYQLDTSGGSGHYRCIQVNSEPGTPCT